MLEDAITCVTLHVMLKQTNSLLHVSLQSRKHSNKAMQAAFLSHFSRGSTQTSVHCVCLLRTFHAAFQQHIFIPLSSRTSASSFRAGISSYFPAKLFTLCPFAPPSSRGAFKPKTLPATSSILQRPQLLCLAPSRRDDWDSPLHRRREATDFESSALLLPSHLRLPSHDVDVKTFGRASKNDFLHPLPVLPFFHFFSLHFITALIAVSPRT